MSMALRSTRRGFLKQTSLATLAGATLPYGWASRASFGFFQASERPVVGCIGTGDRWREVVMKVFPFGEVAAVCDVDSSNVRIGHEIVRKEQEARGANRQVP